MITNLEVSLADMYIGRTVEVSPIDNDVHHDWDH